MSFNNKPFLFAAGVIVLLATAFIYWGIPYFFAPLSLPEIPATLGYGTIRAEVKEIIEEGQIDLDGHIQNYQIARVELLEGEYQGLLMEVDYGIRQLRSDDSIRFLRGDQIYVVLGQRPDGAMTAYYAQTIRTNALLILVFVFVAAILIISGWKGLRSLLSMAFSLAVIIGYVIPHILVGEDPIVVSLIGSALLLGVSLYFTYGWNLKTHASVVSMVFVLIITGSLAALFVSLTRLSGYGSEDALFLIQIPDIQINLKGLLLGGMIIGALGVLDDLVTTQASAVFELHHANPNLSFIQLFAGAMRIGQDHVAATVNTLVLAYAGASLPTLLLFTLGRGNYNYLLNAEFVTEEIVRTMVGSLGLVSAVPLTTVVAIVLALYSHRIPQDWRVLLGSNSGELPGHSH